MEFSGFYNAPSGAFLLGVYSMDTHILR
ncbi:hypothetical protein PO599_26090 [Escherichia coli]|nr:hypothetical protein [Escherichia coli]MDM4996429.1 hypothetical protein [Escherichia coli]WHG29209.1 hypothetical protein QDW93_14865 [Escherichia coli]